jgi:virulence factor Mce-like protein
MTSTTRRVATIRRRLQGVAFLVVLALLLGLAVAEYQKAFTTVARVTLKTDTIGNQLEEASDVKVRGVIVGEVRAVHAAIGGATIDLAIDPQYLKQIPQNVTAQLLPKTLFGERYVSLTIPPHPSTARLADGDVIGQDRTKNAIELQKVIDDTLPLLQAVAPQDLSFTLGAVADALRGRGNALGENLAGTGHYIGEINTVLPQLEKDIAELSAFADTYHAAANDLLGVLDNLSVTNRTIVDQQQQLERTFTVVGSSSDTMAGFLRTNEQNLIRLASTSRPVLGLFARYSPEYPCLLNGLARYDPIDSAAWTGSGGRPALQLNIVVSFPPRNPYQPGDQPAYVATSGPDCRGLSNIDAIIAAARHGEYYCPKPAPDGVHSKDNPVSGNPRCLGGSGPNDVPKGAGNPDSSGGQSLSSPVGSRAELAFVKSLLGYQTGVPANQVPDLAAATMAPLLRGTQVVLP